MALPTDPQLQELARKHQVPFGQVRWTVTQLYLLSSYPTYATRENIECAITHERVCGNYHTAAMLWFILAITEHRISLPDAADLLVALSHGEK